MKQSPEQPPEQPAAVRLSVSVIVDGKLHLPGEPIFTEASLPEHLRQYRVTDETEIPAPPVRNIYGTEQPPTRGNVQWMDDAEEAAVAAANQPLAPDVAAALEHSHRGYIERTKAQMALDRSAGDTTYENAVPASEPIQLFVRRGSVFVRIEKTKLSPGEPVFIKHPGGNHEIIGHVNAAGEPPEPPIVL